MSEHPFDGSWGYQVSSYYAPTARLGDPDDFPRLRRPPSTSMASGSSSTGFPPISRATNWALARFDGTALYEHNDPRRGEQPDWGTLVFNFGRNEVRNFLVANARYWVEEFHVDGLRVDAVASMLYLDYSRREGSGSPTSTAAARTWRPSPFCGEFNEALHADHPGVSRSPRNRPRGRGCPARPTGGLGFNFKWNMGWMHDTLDYFGKDSVYRRYHHHQIDLRPLYALENFLLPLSHDEVVHRSGRCSARCRATGGSSSPTCGPCSGGCGRIRAKLLFMGGELAQGAEWSHRQSLDWHLLEYPEHRGVQRLVQDIGARYLESPSLWERDNSPEGFRWIDAGNADQNILSFVRYDGAGRPGIVCVANFSPSTHHGFRVGMPQAGRWRELLNTDSDAYGGSNQGNLGGVVAEPVGWHGLPFSAQVTVPPLAVVWFAPPEASEARPDPAGPA